MATRAGSHNHVRLDRDIVAGEHLDPVSRSGETKVSGDHRSADLALVDLAQADHCLSLGIVTDEEIPGDEYCVAASLQNTRPPSTMLFENLTRTSGSGPMIPLSVTAGVGLV